MKPLPTTIKKNVFNYVQKNRNDVYAFYEQFYNDILVGHEVFKINKWAERNINGATIESSEGMPSDNQFGLSAWSTGIDYNRALDKYNELCSKEVIA